MTDKEQFLHDFRREANDTCRLLTNVDPQSQSDVLPVRNALNRLVVLRRALRYAKLGRLLNEDEYTVASMSLDGLKGAVTNLAQELETRPGHSVHFRSRRVSMPMRRGAPRYDISKTQLQFLLNCRFKKKQIAAIMHVSTKTVHNRLKTFNLATREYSAITDEDLDSAVRAVMMGNRRIGANAVLTR
ncbi:hypothetical protein BSL78_25576 [Apostichopus japonicus]|uniref:Uncharacterized protein n=1 Tax=Stichopus japonicus TaxID=307972 RepID=A0A2G8JPF8_STIJA|nr:hypothetical protein BSL78_25576 [Apostichopus japonicus]